MDTSTNQENGNLHTLQVILAICVHILVSAALIWDIYVAVKFGKHATVSSIILQWSKTWPILPFMAGLLAGHLFWPQQ